MKDYRKILWTVLLAIAVLCPVLSAAPVYIYNVNLMPDWNQPNDVAGGNLPGYPGWCAPTAVANAFGWWEDTKGALGLTDRLLFNATTAAPPAGSPLGPGQWHERLWQDGTVELGWYMNTGGWQTNNPQLPGANGTQRALIGPRGVNYAKATWVDGLITKAAWANASVTTFVPGGGTTATQIWNDYKSDIDQGLPVVVSWDRWVNSATGALFPGETDIYTYAWGPLLTEGHTVTGIGYIDQTQNMGDEWIIVHDNWSITQQKVAVPLFTFYAGELNYGTNWLQNDHFTVPEPATLSLLVLGGIGAVAGWRRRR